MSWTELKIENWKNSWKFWPNIIIELNFSSIIYFDFEKFTSLKVRIKWPTMIFTMRKAITVVLS